MSTLKMCSRATTSGYYVCYVIANSVTSKIGTVQAVLFQVHTLLPHVDIQFDVHVRVDVHVHLQYRYCAIKTLPLICDNILRHSGTTQSKLPRMVTLTRGPPPLGDPSLADPSLEDPSLVDHSHVHPTLVDPSVVGHSLVDPSLVEHSLMDTSLVEHYLVDPSLVGHSLVDTSLVDPSLVLQKSS
jgi:hypothetical protein